MIDCSTMPPFRGHCLLLWDVRAVRAQCRTPCPLPPPRARHRPGIGPARNRHSSMTFVNGGPDHLRRDNWVTTPFQGGPDHPHIRQYTGHAMFMGPVQDLCCRARRTSRSPPQGMRKLILSTNIAESSVTLPGVDIVIDYGICKEMHWDSATELQSLDEEWCSHDSLKQRAGRTGRVGPGTVYRLIAERDYARLPVTREPEMVRLPLAAQVLRAMQVEAFAGGPYRVFQEALNPPKGAVLAQARDALLDLGCVVPDVDWRADEAGEDDDDEDALSEEESRATSSASRRSVRRGSRRPGQDPSCSAAGASESSSTERSSVRTPPPPPKPQCSASVGPQTGGWEALVEFLQPQAEGDTSPGRHSDWVANVGATTPATPSATPSPHTSAPPSASPSATTSETPSPSTACSAHSDPSALAQCHDHLTHRGQILGLLPLDLPAGLLVLYGVMYGCAPLAACAAAVVSAAHYPTAGRNLWDGVGEARARWRYAGRWENDVVAGVAAYNDFLGIRLGLGEATFATARGRLQSACAERGLDLHALLDLDQLLTRILSALRRCCLWDLGSRIEGWSRDQQQQHALHDALTAALRCRDARLLLTVLVGGAYARHMLEVLPQVAPHSPSPEAALTVRFTGVESGSGNTEAIGAFMAAQGVGRVRAATPIGFTDDVDVVFEAPDRPADAPWPAYLCAKLAPNASGIVGTARAAAAAARGFRFRRAPEACPRLAADVRSLFGKFQRVTLQTQSVAVPILATPDTVDPETAGALACVACRMYCTRRGKNLHAGCLVVLPRSLPGLWKLVLWLFAAEARVQGPAGGADSRAEPSPRPDGPPDSDRGGSGGERGPALWLRVGTLTPDADVHVGALCGAGGRAAAQVRALRRHMRRHLAGVEAFLMGDDADDGEAAGAARDADFTPNAAWESGSGSGSVGEGTAPGADGQIASVDEDSLLPEAAAAGLLALVKALHDPSAVPAWGHFGAWRAGVSGHALDALLMGDGAQEEGDPWVRATTSRQVAAEEALLRYSDPPVGSDPERDAAPGPRTSEGCGGASAALPGPFAPAPFAPSAGANADSLPPPSEVPALRCPSSAPVVAAHGTPGGTAWRPGPEVGFSFLESVPRVGDPGVTGMHAELWAQGGVPARHAEDLTLGASQLCTQNRNRSQTPTTGAGPVISGAAIAPGRAAGTHDILAPATAAAGRGAACDEALRVLLEMGVVESDARAALQAAGGVLRTAVGLLFPDPADAPAGAHPSSSSGLVARRTDSEGRHPGEPARSGAGVAPARDPWVAAPAVLPGHGGGPRGPERGDSRCESAVFDPFAAEHSQIWAPDSAPSPARNSLATAVADCVPASRPRCSHSAGPVPSPKAPAVRAEPAPGIVSGPSPRPSAPAPSDLGILEVKGAGDHRDHAPGADFDPFAPDACWLWGPLPGSGPPPDPQPDTEPGLSLETGADAADDGSGPSGSSQSPRPVLQLPAAADLSWQQVLRILTEMDAAAAAADAVAAHYNLPTRLPSTPGAVLQRMQQCVGQVFSDAQAQAPAQSLAAPDVQVRTQTRPQALPQMESQQTATQPPSLSASAPTAPTPTTTTTTTSSSASTFSPTTATDPTTATTTAPSSSTTSTSCTTTSAASTTTPTTSSTTSSSRQQPMPQPRTHATPSNASKESVQRQRMDLLQRVVDGETTAELGAPAAPEGWQWLQDRAEVAARLSRGWDPNTAVPIPADLCGMPHEHCTALWLACHWGCRAVAAELLAHGAEPRRGLEGASCAAQDSGRHVDAGVAGAAAAEVGPGTAEGGPAEQRQRCYVPYDDDWWPAEIVAVDEEEGYCEVQFLDEGQQWPVERVPLGDVMFSDEDLDLGMDPMDMEAGGQEAGDEAGVTRARDDAPQEGEGVRAETRGCDTGAAGGLRVGAGDGAATAADSAVQDADRAVPEAGQREAVADASGQTEFFKLREYLLKAVPDEELEDAGTLLEYSRWMWRRADVYTVYGLRPRDLFACGATLLNRTVMECKPDRIAEPMVEQVCPPQAFGAPRDPPRSMVRRSRSPR